MLTLDDIAARYSKSAPRPPIVLDEERQWALLRRPSWLPPDQVKSDVNELADDDAQLDCPAVERERTWTWEGVVAHTAEEFEAYYRGEVKTYDEWQGLWRKVWWPKVDPRKYFPKLAPVLPTQPFFKRGSRDFERALEIGAPDELAMWQRFGVAQFRPEDPRLAYLTSGDRDTVRRRCLSLAAEQFPAGIVCLSSALFVHGLIDTCEPKVWMWADDPPIEASGVRFFSGGSAKLFSKGFKEQSVGGNTIRVTTPARSIVDCFSWYGDIGLEVAEKALRRGVQGKVVTPDELLKISDGRKVARPLIQSALGALSTSRAA